MVVLSFPLLREISREITVAKLKRRRAFVLGKKYNALPIPAENATSVRRGHAALESPVIAA
jgi:hypothetical protein